ncbi:hypothetical protein AC1031_017645 [Aphanomyces cochlioides]|nr:hypothetical protein AC1031_017645 [Aphanomyces cochlioides]
MRLVIALMLALVALAVGSPQALETIKESPFEGLDRVTLKDHLKIPMSPPGSPRQGLRRGGHTTLRRVASSTSSSGHSSPQRGASPERKQSRRGGTVAKGVSKVVKCLSKLCRAK